MRVNEIIEQLKVTEECKVMPPSGFPIVPQPLRIPDDLREFYRNCGGVEMFLGSDFGYRIASPDQFVLANRAILGDEFFEAHLDMCVSDITNSWYLIAVGAGSEMKISIDLGESRLGWCYDSFWEVHGRADSDVIAHSFTELLERLLVVRGRTVYWKGPGGPDYGHPR